MRTLFWSSVKDIEEVYEDVVSERMSEEDLNETVIQFYKAGHGSAADRDPQACIIWGEYLNEINTMPRDVFCDLVGTPTHRVVAIMMYALLHSQRVWNFNPIHAALYAAMNGAIKCGFRGQGYEAEEIMEKNLEIYERAGLNEFLDQYSFFNERFTETIVNIRKHRDEVKSWHEQDKKHAESVKQGNWGSKD